MTGKRLCQCKGNRKSMLPYFSIRKPSIRLLSVVCGYRNRASGLQCRKTFWLTPEESNLKEKKRLFWSTYSLHIFLGSGIQTKTKCTCYQKIVLLGSINLCIQYFVFKFCEYIRNDGNLSRNEKEKEAASSRKFN